MSQDYIGKNYAGFDLAMACGSAAMGIGFGTLVGFLIFCIHKHSKEDNF